MDWGTYNKAIELNMQMDYLTELEGIIINSTTPLEKTGVRTDRALAAINIEEYEDARRIVVTQCEVLNHTALSEEFRDKFLELIRAEREILSEAFKNL